MMSYSDDYSMDNHYLHFDEEVPLNDEESVVPKMRPSTYLTIRLLREIRSAISNFRPSQSLAMLSTVKSYQSVLSLDDTSQLNNETEAKAEIDIVISGGGLKGYFMAGCAEVLLSQLMRHKISISRISGASAGAWAAMFMLCGVKAEHWIETYHQCYDHQNKLIHEIYEKIAAWLIPLLPEDAYIKCCERLYISVTVLTWRGPVNKIISEYYSNNDLLECCFASSTIPYLTERNGLRRFRGELVCDGGLTNNCPIFPDGSHRQLVFRLYEVEYPYRLLVNARGNILASVNTLSDDLMSYL
jgi:hypothetical protein